MRWRIWARPFSPYVFLLMAGGLLGLTVILTLGSVATQDRERWVVHTLEVLRNVARCEAKMLEAEAKSLDSWQNPELMKREVEQALTEAQARVTALRRLTGDVPQQSARVAALQVHLTTLKGLIEERMRRRPDPGSAAALQASQPISNTLLAMPIQHTIQEIGDEARSVLRLRQREQAAADFWYWRLTVLVISFTVLMVGWAYFASRQYVAERNETETQIRRLNESLEDRIREKTAELEAKVQELRRTNAELERFAHVASHDLQEPLRQIAGFNSLLLMKYGEQLDETGKRYLTHSIAGAKRMQLMLRGLLHYATLGAQPRRNEDFAMQAVVDKALREVRRDAAEAKAEIEVEVPAGMVARGDDQLVVTCLAALLSNAIRFRREDETARIRVTCRRSNSDWEIGVRDNGVGVDPRFLPRMFDVFSRDQGVEADSGAGMGLAIAKRVAEMHGGRLSVSANEGEPGSCFRLVIPYPQEEKAGAAA